MLELLLIAIGLCMDTLAVSIASGCSMKPYKTVFVIRFAVMMAVFQAVMPFLGWLAGETVVQYIKDYDHWIAAVLLAFIGGKMIFEGCRKDKKEDTSFHPNSFFVMITLAVATSIDALAIGFSYAALNRNIVQLIIACGATTFLFAIGGLYIGHKFGKKRKNLAGIVGGIILIAIGLKILVEHLSA